MTASLNITVLFQRRSPRYVIVEKYKPSYPQAISDWQQTRKLNGKIVSDLRKQARNKLEQEQGEEYCRAIALRKAVDKYFTFKGIK